MTVAVNGHHHHDDDAGADLTPVSSFQHHYTQQQAEYAQFNFLESHDNFDYNQYVPPPPPPPMDNVSTSDGSSTIHYDNYFQSRRRVLMHRPSQINTNTGDAPFRPDEFELPVRPRPRSLGPDWSDHLPSRPPFDYPEGYHCDKCENTGIKLKNNKSCQTCYARFAAQDPDVVVLNPPISTRQKELRGAKYPKSRKARVMRPIMKVIDPLPDCPPVMVKYGKMSPIVVQPGDPAIGGTMCGRCRGVGVVNVDVIYESTCKTCLGLGRLI